MGAQIGFHLGEGALHKTLLRKLGVALQFFLYSRVRLEAVFAPSHQIIRIKIKSFHPKSSPHELGLDRTSVRGFSAGENPDCWKGSPNNLLAERFIVAPITGGIRLEAPRLHERQIRDICEPTGAVAFCCERLHRLEYRQSDM
ncbi:hypothetical protein [Massilia glaciei]|uniref:hypothetical protein n=1 Tax=Massilia glaciei TaxID=1524097 RepID=UPI0011B24A70|nr:hypothetical protein [Massilia glaciei]